MNGCGHIDSRCDHVLTAKLGNKCEILIWVCDWPKYVFPLWFPYIVHIGI